MKIYYYIEKIRRLWYCGVMYVFMLLAIPCFLCWYSYSLKNFKITNFIPQAMIGISISIVVCMIVEFFIYAKFVYTASFGDIFFFHLFTDSLIPCLAVYGFFLLISIKRDDFEYRVNSFAPLMLGFYLVYLPYFILTGDLKHSVFMIFFKPVLYIFQIWLIQQALDFGYRLITRRKDLRGIIALAGAPVLTIFVPLIETMWYLQVSAWAYGFLMLLLAGGTITEYVLVQRKGDDFVLFSNGAGVVSEAAAE